ncbi:MAG: RHS repeat domain-containing protein [Calditrichia bacterium]
MKSLWKLYSSSWLLLCLILSTVIISAAESNKKYYFKDHRGSTRVVVDQGGAVTETYDYYPFGLQMPERIMTSGASTKNLFTGKEHDDETGWDYFGARYYSAALGRWMVVDPLSGDYPGSSPYNYALNNPLTLIDPDGKKVRFAPGSTAKFKEAFSQAVEHLNKYGAGGLLAELESRPETVYIEQDDVLPHFDDRSNIIYWSPTLGGETDRGVVESPATILNHEVDHALQFVKNPEQYEKDIKTPDPNYDTKEEKRVITGSEQETARKLGETKKGQVTRTNNKGELVKTSGPTSNVKLPDIKSSSSTSEDELGPKPPKSEEEDE